MIYFHRPYAKEFLQALLEYFPRKKLLVFVVSNIKLRHVLLQMIYGMFSPNLLHTKYNYEKWLGIARNVHKKCVVHIKTRLAHGIILMA